MYRRVADALSRANTRVSDGLFHLAQVIMGNYLGKGPSALKENISRIRDTDSRKVIVQTLGGMRVKGELVHYQPGEGFLMQPDNPEKLPATVEVFAREFYLYPSEVERSYLAGK